MKKIYIVFSLVMTSILASAQCSDLYISEVTEGTGFNKYMELYNPTGSTVYLSGYALANTSNAPTTAGEYEFWLALPASDSIVAGGTYVIGDDRADSIIVANTDLSHNFLSNGDDGYKLVKGGTWNDANTNGTIEAGEMTGFTVLDAVGDWQGDPGSGWDVAGVVGGTQDNTLVRKSWYGGNSDWTASAGTDAASSEWLVISKDDWSGLGNHRSVCTGIQNPGYDIEGNDSYRDFWRNLDFEDQIPNTNLLQITTSPVQAGTRAGKFPSSGDRIAYQAVTVKPMTNYTIKFWYTIKTGNVGSATVHILEGDIRDTANVAAATITSKTVNDQVSANDYVLDSVQFTSGSTDIIAIYLRNEGEECRFDTWSIEEDAAPATEPMTAAVDPTADAANVISIYSETYGNNAGTDFYPNWGQNTQYSVFEIGMDSMLKYSNLNYQGIQFGSDVDASSMEFLHMDIWTADVDDVLIFPISRTTGEKSVTATLTSGEWTSVDISLADYTSQGLSMADLFQFKFDNLGTSRDMGTIFVDNIYFYTVPEAEPMTAAPTPTQAAEDVISIYSQSYTDPATINYYPNWGQSTQFADFAIGTDSMIKYSSINYQGIDFDASQVDASAMEMLHIDIWTADVDDIDIFPISRATGEKAVKSTLTAGEWNSIDIPLTDYTSQGLSMADIWQFKFDNLGASRGTGTIFIDNMYMWKEPTKVYTVADIADVIMLDADLAPTNEGSLYEVTGVVHGIDYDGDAGLSFTIIDATAGINVFSFVDVNDYVVTEGDEITVRGEIDFYRGLLEIVPDSIKVNSSGNDLNDPIAVDAPTEATESNLIVLSKVWVTNDTTTVWPNNESPNFGNVEFTNEAGDIFVVRIDKDILDMQGVALIADTMDIVGISSQFDASAPYDEGYQVFPRGLADVTAWVSDVNSVRENVIVTKVYPNPTSSNLTIVGTELWDSYEVYSVLGVKVSEGNLTNNNLSVLNLNDGTYILKLASGSKQGVARFVVNR